MYPIYHSVDHRLPSDELLPWESRAPRRSQPTRMVFTIPAPGAPMVAVQTQPLPEPISRGGGGAAWLARLFRKRIGGPAM